MALVDTIFILIEYVQWKYIFWKNHDYGVHTLCNQYNKLLFFVIRLK